ncbi:hypothetical protein R1sor_016697 [Riccia sorocarpa]|uniref:Uncharacterized protein n=1 Tax=Riccia sorocarpa TaxID=122646 RepID=A0ABD3HG57_9MARC
MPVKWGRLGILSAEDFQTALICRVLLKALQNPLNALWAPIFTNVFLDTDCHNLLDTLVAKDPDTISSACPVASLLLTSWTRLISLFQWIPKEAGHHHSTTLKGRFSLKHGRSLAFGRRVVWHLLSFAVAQTGLLSPINTAPGAGVTLEDWVAEDGTGLDLNWTASQIYARLTVVKLAP